MGDNLSEELMFQLEMYCQGSVYMTVKWLLDGTKESCQTMAKLLTDSMPEVVKKTFVELHLI